MPEQLLSLRTVYGWLAVLAALSVVERSGRGPTELADAVAFPAAVIDLRRHAVFVMSPGMRQLLGFDQDPGTAPDVRQLVERSNHVEALLDLLASGSVDAYQAQRAIRRRDGRSLDAHIWVAVSEQDRRDKAVWVLAPVGDDPGRHLPPPTESTWPTLAAGVIVGTMGLDWRIERVSADVEGLLGYSPDEMVGTPLVALVHADDAPAMLQAAAQSVVDRAGVAVAIRVRHRWEGWLGAQAVLTPLAEPELQFGLVLAITATQRDDDPYRVAALERRLWRIAREVEEAGIVAGFDAVPDPRTLPGLADLSPREWEILTRVLGGQRAPSIAAELYLSPSTIRNYLSQIYRKLGVHSRTELLAATRAASRQRTRRERGHSRSLDPSRRD